MKTFSALDTATRRLGTLAALASLTLVPHAAANAAAVYAEDWSGGTAAGWRSAPAAVNSVTHDAGAGNPAGSLRTQLMPGPVTPSLGAHAEDVPELRGDYGGASWNVSFDLRLDAGEFDQVALRYRYQDFSFNGWSYLFNGVLGQYGVWHTLSASFNADWSDAEAIAAGWVQDNFAAVGFAQTMSNVYWTHVYLGMSDTASFGSAHIDNFRLTRVPEPAPLLLALGALGVIALRRRRPEGR